MSGWMSNSSEFLDYDSYKLKISSIWEKIWDKIESIDDNIDNLWEDIDIKVENEEKNLENDSKNNLGNSDETNVSQVEWRQTIKSFPKFEKPAKVPELKIKDKQEIISEDWALTWYSKSDLIWVINKYIEKNLDDDTDILVTVEYEDDSGDPQKIILQTQPSNLSELYKSSSSESLINDLFE